MREEDKGKSQRQLEREAGEREAAAGKEYHTKIRPYAPKVKRDARKSKR